MNAVIIYKHINLDELNIEKILYRYVPFNTNNKYLHQISIILLMYLLNKYNKDYTDILKTYHYSKDNIPIANINFSNSYCDDYIVVGISDNNIGVDIEKNNNYEIDILHSNEENFDTTCIFTLKESLGKYLRVGLNYNYKNIDLSSRTFPFYRYGCYFDSIKFDNYVLSTCSNFNKMDFINIDDEELNKFINSILTK